MSLSSLLYQNVKCCLYLTTRFMFLLLMIFTLRSQLSSSLSPSLPLSIVKDNYTMIMFKKVPTKEYNLLESSRKAVDDKYEEFFMTTGSKFLAPETLHSPFNPPSTIEHISALPIAYGDFDADKYTDLYILTNNGTTIELLKGQSCVDGKTVLTFFGSRRCLSHMKNFACHFQTPIYNLIASDFTGRLQQDLLVTVRSKKPDDDDDVFLYDIILVKGNSFAIEEFNCSEQKLLVQNALSEPFILDFNGDMISDFIVETKHCSLQLILGGNYFEVDQNELNEANISINSICLDYISSIKNLAHPHASGFLNLNSHFVDLTPDLFINGQESFEYIYNDPGKGFDKSNVVQFRFPDVSTRGQSAFVDLNYDGQMEHLIPVCKDSEFFNECHYPDLMVFHVEKKEWYYIMDSRAPLGSNFNRTLTFATLDVYDYISLPVTLHIGDINYDGYPDFATILMDMDTKKTVAAIFLNKVQSEQNPFGHWFELDWISDNKDDVIMVSLFDIFNNGRLNLLMTTQASEDKQFSLEAYDYYFEKSIYFSFLRLNVISGLCSDKSELHPCPNHLAFGSTPPGVTVCFDGPYDDMHSCSVQIAQSAHFAMQPPYIIFGLGETLNVINNLAVSIANGEKTERFRNWNEIIPGSKLVIVPYEPDRSTDWELRVFINMSIYSLVALLFLLILGLILTFVISILHFREKVEDRVDNQQYRKVWLH